jgi:hypothetical protein
MNEIEALKRRHKELEEALTAVESHVSLTAKEQTDRARLKKEKLAIKDRIQVLLAQQSQFPWGINT